MEPKTFIISAEAGAAPLPTLMESQRERLNPEYYGKLVVSGAIVKVREQYTKICPIVLSQHKKPLVVDAIIGKSYSRDYENKLRFDRFPLLSIGMTLNLKPFCGLRFPDFFEATSDVSCIQITSAFIKGQSSRWGYIPLEALLLRDNEGASSGWRIFRPQPVQATPRNG